MDSLTSGARAQLVLLTVTANLRSSQADWRELRTELRRGLDSYGLAEFRAWGERVASIVHGAQRDFRRLRAVLRDIPPCDAVEAVNLADRYQEFVDQVGAVIKPA